MILVIQNNIDISDQGLVSLKSNVYKYQTSNPKFFAGGDRTVRGFDSGSLGPLMNNTTCTAKTCDAIGGDVIYTNCMARLHVIIYNTI